MRNIQIPSNLINELGVPQIIDITDELPKLGASGWDGLVAPRSLEALTDIAWHHSGVFLTDGGSPQKHAQTHVRNGEGGCPYHFILLNGQWYQCNDVLTFTYGVSNNNYQTVHVCVEGCFAPDRGRHADLLSGANKAAMIALELTLREVLPNYQRSKGHNYYKPTLCPGFSMTKFMEEVATLANRIKAQSTWSAKLTKIGELANQYNFMWDKIQLGESDGDAQWGMNELLGVRDVLKSKGLLKPDNSSNNG